MKAKWRVFIIVLAAEVRCLHRMQNLILGRGGPPSGRRWNRIFNQLLLEEEPPGTANADHVLEPGTKLDPNALRAEREQTER